jgi:hypothetical protein
VEKNLKKKRIKINKAKTMFTGHSPPTHPSRAPRRNKKKPGADIRYDKQDQQGKAAFNERNPHRTAKHV